MIDAAPSISKTYISDIRILYWTRTPRSDQMLSMKRIVAARPFDTEKPILAVQICDDSGGDVAKIELDDIVRSAQKLQQAKNKIKLRLQKKDGTEYSAFLLIPEKFLDKGISAINVGMTLREIGLLDI
jgi:hypothetical protein